jgi:hypothetical protein
MGLSDVPLGILSTWNMGKSSFLGNDCKYRDHGDFSPTACSNMTARASPKVPDNKFSSIEMRIKGCTNDIRNPRSFNGQNTRFWDFTD